MYSIGVALLIIVVTLIPIMLLVKPCCFSGIKEHQEEEDHEIEMADAAGARMQPRDSTTS